MTTQAAALVIQGQPGRRWGLQAAKRKDLHTRLHVVLMPDHQVWYVKTQILAFGWEGWTLDPTKAESRPLPLYTNFFSKILVQ